MGQANAVGSIEIDCSALDVEWLRQPGLMREYSRLQAQAERAMDLAKSALDVARAELDRAIRANPSAHGVEKITEGAISSAITLSPEYKEAETRFLDARYDFQVVRGAVRAVEHRKDALENLVRLHGQAYFAGPATPRDLQKSWGEQAAREKRATQSIAQAMVGRARTYPPDDTPGT